jgi:hypothetical protein
LRSFLSAGCFSFRFSSSDAWLPFWLLQFSFELWLRLRLWLWIVSCSHHSLVASSSLALVTPASLDALSFLADRAIVSGRNLRPASYLSSPLAPLPRFAPLARLWPSLFCFPGLCSLAFVSLGHFRLSLSTTAMAVVSHLAYCQAFVSLWRNDLCLVLVAFLVIRLRPSSLARDLCSHFFLDFHWILRCFYGEFLVFINSARCLYGESLIFIGCFALAKTMIQFSNERHGAHSNGLIISIPYLFHLESFWTQFLVLIGCS